jgi:hypothetical protein
MAASKTSRLLQPHLVPLLLLLLLLLPGGLVALDTAEQSEQQQWPPSDQGPEHWDWTLRPPDPTEAAELEGSNVCTKQET